MKKIVGGFVMLVVGVLLAASAWANDREQFSVGELTVETSISVPADSLAISDIDTDGSDGTVSNLNGYAATDVGEVKKLVVTFTNLTQIATDGSDEGETKKFYVLPAGCLSILGASLNGTCTLGGGATSACYIAVGTAAAADDSDLTSTEANIIPKTTLTGAGTNLVASIDAVLAAPLIIDGSATTAGLWFNFACDDDNMNAAVTNSVTSGSTFTLWYVNIGDNQ